MHPSQTFDLCLQFEPRCRCRGYYVDLRERAVKELDQGSCRRWGRDGSMQLKRGWGITSKVLV